jgi:hypothetical protein
MPQPNLSDVKHHVHDCDACTFLGSTRGEADLYYCPQSDMPTVIVRYGSDGPDYESGMPSYEFAQKHPEALRVLAAQAAAERGLMAPLAPRQPRFPVGHRVWDTDLESEVEIVGVSLDPPAGFGPVYRVKNPTSGQHFIAWEDDLAPLPLPLD